MTVHMIDGRTQYFDDEAWAKGCWPFWECFGLWFPSRIKLKGERFLRVLDLAYAEVRAVYRNKDHSKLICIKSDCTFSILKNEDCKDCEKAQNEWGAWHIAMEARARRTGRAQSLANQPSQLCFLHRGR